MAEVIITIKDTEAGLVDVRLDFTPPLKGGVPATPTQAAALEAVESIQAYLAGTDDE